jgi:hypothetical protein
MSIAKPDIVKLFESNSKRVYTWENLATLLSANRENWRLTQRTTVNEFAAFLQEKTLLKRIELKSANYNSIFRYIWGEPSVYEIGLSVKPRAYLSHGTAVFLHGMTQQLPTTIYVNQEQSPKPRPPGQLSQEGIKRAFSNQQRQSSFIFRYTNWQFLLISGKSTGRLEVGKLPGPLGENLEVTTIERTLIDIAVRPAYAGVYT